MNTVRGFAHVEDVSTPYQDEKCGQRSIVNGNKQAAKQICWRSTVTGMVKNRPYVNSQTEQHQYRSFMGAKGKMESTGGNVGMPACAQSQISAAGDNDANTSNASVLRYGHPGNYFGADSVKIFAI